MSNGFEPRRPYRRPQPTGTVEGLQGPLSAGQLFRAGRSAFYREDEQEALDYLLEALRLAPGNLHIHYLAAMCANLLSEEETLEDICRHALELDPRHPYSLACEAARYFFLSNLSRAEDLFRKALNLLPDDVDILLGLGILHEFADDDEKDTAAFERVLELDPKNVRARMALGIAYALNGEYQNALMEYERAKSADPDVENPHQRLGRDYYLNGMWGEAASEFCRATAEEPEQPAAYFYLMDCYSRMGRTDDTLDVYETIATTFADQPEVTSGYYEHFHLQREAVAAVEVLARRYPEDAYTRYRLSQVYRAAGRLDDAILEAEVAARLGPDDWRHFSHLGSLLFDKEEYGRAVQVLQRATRLNPNDQAGYTLLADAQLFLGHTQESEEAIAEMERNRDLAWKRYQSKFSGQDRADSGG
ncbi:tetratricopeptide repeat protein [candidate division WOR-3 bacterium]|nr:tetratricopeptide repeat protein [candidate division WOR-3 bacterium]